MALPEICVSSSRHATGWPVIDLAQQTQEEIIVTLTDSECAAIELDPATQSVHMYVKEMLDSTEFYIDEACVINSSGKITLTLEGTDLPYPGTWVGEFTVTNIASTAITGRYRFYLNVDANLTKLLSQHTPLTIPEVRMAVRDRCAEDNTFLDDVEFSDTEIVLAIRRPIDYWNEVPPNITPNYTPVTFPYRYYWLEGTIGELLRIAALNLTRNKAPVQAGGIAMDDNSRSETYLKLSAMFMESYRNWVVGQKYAINVSQGWGSTSLSVYDNTKAIY